MPCKHGFLSLSLLFMCFITPTQSYNLMNIRPRLMGNAIPLPALMPSRIQVQRKIVAFHNFFRSRVVPRARNMLRMKWHRGAAKAAQRWADQCMFLTHDNITGRHVDGYGACGQNIFVATHQVPWLFALKNWYQERTNFTYGSRTNDLKVVGHYLQMVWASTHEVGCGLSRCFRDGNAIRRTYYNYVCNYCPIGNIPSKGGRPYRRGRPCASCGQRCHRARLCTNSCPSADLWANCGELRRVWPEWLCDSSTEEGRVRAKRCAATCGCEGMVHD